LRADAGKRTAPLLSVSGLLDRWNVVYYSQHLIAIRIPKIVRKETCWQVQSRQTHLKTQTGASIKMPAHFIGSAGSHATILRQESRCIRFFACRERRQSQPKSRKSVSVAKPVVGVLRTKSRQQKSQQRKHL
jgi:hypothetical protein